MKKSVSLSEEDSVCWETVETVETNDPDVAEYLRTIQNKENDNIIEIKKEISDSEGHLIDLTEPLQKNNRNTEHRKNSCLQFATDDGGKKAKKARKVEENADDAAILVISGALQNVKELYESTGKCDDVAYNFCITTYSQLKTMSKAKQKIARSRISSIMLELESD